MSGRTAWLTGAARVAAALAFGLVLAACDFSGLMPKEHIDFAKAVVMLVQNRDAEGLEAVSDPRLWDQLTPDVRAQMARQFPAGRPADIGVATYRSAYTNGVTNVTIVLRYVYPDTVVHASVAFHTAEHGYVLTAVHVAPGGAPGRPSADTQREM